MKVYCYYERRLDENHRRLVGVFSKREDAQGMMDKSSAFVRAVEEVTVDVELVFSLFEKVKERGIS